MARTLRSDKVLFWEAVALVCASLVLLYSASAVVASNRDANSYGVFLHQLPWALLGSGEAPLPSRDQLPAA